MVIANSLDTAKSNFPQSGSEIREITGTTSH